MREVAEGVAEELASATGKPAADLFRVLHEIGRTLVSELDLERVVETVTDAATEITGAAFGAFFYNVIDERGEALTLYALSGVERSAFERFPLPRKTLVFAPTFNGERTVRFADVTQEPVYGHSEPHLGMPEGHLPVRSYLATPVIARDGQVLGGLFFGHPEAGRFGADDEVLIEGIAGYAAVAITNATEFEAEKRIALTLQRALLPTVRSYEGADVAATYLPAAQRAEVGGDWYDAVQHPDGRITLTVGDVAGHSVAAAARMGAVRHALGVYAFTHDDPGEALLALDRYLEATDQPGFVTIVQARYDPATGEIAVARAGHPPPLVIPAEGDPWLLPGDPSPPIGAGLHRRAPKVDVVQLAPGDAVVFYTDGLVERRGRDIDEMLEELLEVAGQLTPSSASELCGELSWAMLHPGGVGDDVALLSLVTTGVAVAERRSA